MRRYLPFIIVGAVLLLTLGGGLLLFRSHTSAPLKIASGKPGAEPSHIRGPRDARVTLEEFGDFQCPLLRLPGRDAPGSGTRLCGEREGRLSPVPVGHAPARDDAAMHSGSGGIAGFGFGKCTISVFKLPPFGAKSRRVTLSRLRSRTARLTRARWAWQRAVFSDYAAKLGLDVQRFNKDMESEQVKARINLDQERATSIGVDRTPMLFIDGVQIPFSSLGEKELRGVIDTVLSGKAPAFPSPTPTSAPPQIPISGLPPMPAPSASASPVSSPPK